jgi:hypothetical protein
MKREREAGTMGVIRLWIAKVLTTAVLKTDDDPATREVNSCFSNLTSYIFLFTILQS